MQPTTFFPLDSLQNKSYHLYSYKRYFSEQYKNKRKIQTTDSGNSRLSLVVWCTFLVSWTQITKSCKDQDITPEPDRVSSLQETNTVVIRDAVQNAATIYSFNRSRRKKFSYFFLLFVLCIF